LLKVENLSKTFVVEEGKLAAVDQIHLEIPQGQFFTLLGPSGCGKTTTLRCIAGLEVPAEGEIWIGDRPVFSSTQRITTMPEEREIGMVFQSYAIWPHMNVFQNVAFPLRVGLRKQPRQVVKERVEWALSLVHMEGLEDRPATRLSGGQQQRVALARALVGQPKLLLLDEPLSNLDAKLREEMRVELRRLQSSLALTALYVTHDQSEALAMSDKIAVMQAGKIIQLGTPKEIYERPVDPFTVSFVGSTNMVPGTVHGIKKDDLYSVDTQEGRIHCLIPQESSPQSRVLVSIRPEDIRVHPEAPSSKDQHNVWSGHVKQLVYLGDCTQCEVETEKGIVMKVRINPPLEVQLGQKIHLSFDPHRCIAVIAN